MNVYIIILIIIISFFKKYLSLGKTLVFTRYWSDHYSHSWSLGTRHVRFPIDSVVNACPACSFFVVEEYSVCGTLRYMTCRRRNDLKKQ